MACGQAMAAPPVPVDDHGGTEENDTVMAAPSVPVFKEEETGRRMESPARHTPWTGAFSMSHVIVMPFL